MPLRLLEVRTRLFLSLLCGLMLLGGCRREPAAKPPAAPVDEPPLRVLVLDDEELAAAIELKWNSRPGGKCKVRNMLATELLAAPPERLGTDVVFYPSHLLGEFAERSWISPIGKQDLDDPQFDRAGLFELTRLHEIVWGQQTFAVPLGSPQFVLFYRADVFEKLSLTPPTTWAEYQALLPQLSDRQALGELAPPEGTDWFATAEPTAASSSGSWFLARAAAYCRHPSQYSALFDFNSMEPLIAGPPFVRALEELAAARQYAAPGELSTTDARRLLLAGQTAMAVSWPSQADDVSPPEGTGSELRIGVAELPGAIEVYNVRDKLWEERPSDQQRQVTLLGASGRLGSVTKECKRERAALGMLFAISGSELGNDVPAASKRTTLFRETQLANVAAWCDRQLAGTAAQQYGIALQSTLTRSMWLDALRIPGHAEYLAALETAIQAASTGTQPATDALEKTAQAWRTITAAHDQQRQRAAYMRSLGLEP